MEKENLQIAIIERFNNLQPEIQNIIINTNYEENLYKISKKHNLTDEQYKDLEINTTLVLLGNTHPDEYRNELIEDLIISDTEASSLVSDVNENILNKVLPIIKQNFLDESSEPKKEEPISYTKKFFIPDPLFSNLPKDLQEAIYYSNWKDKLYNIAKKYNLAVNKMGELETITAKTISGEVKTDQYENEIKTKINPSEDKAKEMVAEINEVVFKNIKDNMQGGEIITDEKTGKIGVPIPPYKVIRNEELKMKNENADKKMPLPPYMAGSKQEVVNSKNDEMSIKEKKIESNTKEHEDMYREHGIEIVGVDDSVVPVIKKEESSFTPSFMRENTTRKEKVPDINTENIISNKLFNKTTSQTVVTDYSLPKINSQMQSIPRMQSEAPKKPHDPYHEEI